MNDYRHSLDAYGQVTEVDEATSEQVWQRCREYFQWVRQNPIIVEKTQSGRILRYHCPRAYTLTGLRLFVGVDLANPKYERVIEMALDFMNSENLVLGLAEVLNPMLIARTLGLPDKAEIIQPGVKDPTPSVNVQIAPWKKSDA